MRGEDKKKLAIEEKSHDNEGENTVENNVTENLVEKPAANNALKQMFGVFQEIRLCSLMIILNYTQTFMMFPGVTLLKKMTIMDVTWKTVGLISSYNVLDSVGKSLTNNRNWYTKYSVAIIVFGRFAFFLSFILMACYDNIPIISDDWFAFVNVGLFALTNGFATSALFILAPEQVSSEKREIAGFVMMFSLQFGITFGSFLALSFQNLGK